MDAAVLELQPDFLALGAKGFYAVGFHGDLALAGFGGGQADVYLCTVDEISKELLLFQHRMLLLQFNNLILILLHILLSLQKLGLGLIKSRHKRCYPLIMLLQQFSPQRLQLPIHNLQQVLNLQIHW